ncbi:hypothetical protein F2P56_035200, partial [Juglans regia]
IFPLKSSTFISFFTSHLICSLQVQVFRVQLRKPLWTSRRCPSPATQHHSTTSSPLHAVAHGGSPLSLSLSLSLCVPSHNLSTASQPFQFLTYLGFLPIRTNL